MKTQTLRNCYAGLVTLALSGFLVGCTTSTPKTSAASSEVDSPSSPTELSSEEAPATLSEISKQPVWVQLLNATNETSAQQGISLRVGEKVRTHKDAVAQVDFKNGLGFRVGGDSVVSLEPNNNLKLSEGEILVWVDPGKKVPTEIITRGAITKLQGTTVSVKILKELDHAVEIFVWEGSVTVEIPNQPGAVTISSGQEVRIWSGETDIQQVRQRIRRVPYQDWSQRRFQSPLLNNFNKPLPTLLTLDQASPPMTAPETSRVSRTRETNPRKASISRSDSRLNQQANLGFGSRPSPVSRTQQVTRNQTTARTPIRRSSGQANPASRPTRPPAQSEQLDLGSYFPEPQSSPTPTPSPTQLTSPEQTDVSESIRRLIRQTNPEVETATPTPSPTQEATPQGGSTNKPDRVLSTETTPSTQRNNPTPSPTQEATSQGGSTNKPGRALITETTPSVQRNSPTQEATPQGGSTNKPGRALSTETTPSAEGDSPTPSPTEQVTPVEPENSTPAPSPKASPIESPTPESTSPVRRPIEEATPASPIPGKTDRAED